MIASDIHGSAKYCRQLLQCFDKENSHKLILLGDILYHGPRNDLPEQYEPKKVIEMLNSYKEKIMCIQGNCDTQVDQMVLEFPILTQTLCLYVDGHYIYASHGHIENPENPPFLTHDDILLNGHTHVAKVKQYENFLYVNPGSVSIPKENTNRGYMIYENNKFIWKTLNGEKYMEYELHIFS